MNHPFKIACLFVSLSGISFGVNAQPADEANLSLNRPVTVSSTDQSPTPAEFAVDGEYDTGWQAKAGSFPQWISVDLQAECLISGIELLSEANNKTPIPDLSKPYSREGTLGSEIYSSYPTSYKIEVSPNGFTWATIQANTEAKGGKTHLKLPSFQKARFVRVFIEKASNSLPVGINEIKVLGSCESARPATLGWTERRMAKASAVPELTLEDNCKLPINSGWELTRNGWNNANDGATISKPGFDTQLWYNATVPGTIVTTLVDQEVFPHPAIGLNNLKIPEALSRHNWWYRRGFAIPENFNGYEGKRIFLELEGINFKANIWFNGQKVGSIPSAFLKGTFEVTDWVNKGTQNVIAVEICPMSNPGVPAEKGEHGSAWVQSGKVTQDGATFACSSGWDWMPAMRDRGMGILGTVKLISKGTVVIDYPRVSSRLPLPDTTSARLTIEVPVRNISSKEQKTTVSLQSELFSISKEVKLKAGESQLVLFNPNEFAQLNLKNPKLWWPNGYGNPNLYQLNIKANVNGTQSDSHSLKFGIREITYNTESLINTRRGQSDFKLTKARYVRINCKESMSDHYALFDLCIYNSGDLNTDLAALKPITATTSNENLGKLSNYGPVKNANDAYQISRWISNGTGNQFITVDLGKVVPFDRVVAGWIYGIASKYSIEVSTDSLNWKTVAECTQKYSPPLVLSVNGIRVYCRGGNWGLFDIALKMPEKAMKQSILFHKELGFNMIRNWMGNTMTSVFFDYCDEYGILVMNDFWGSNPKDVEAYIKVARENVQRFRNHPSLAFWCGSNESYPPPYIDEGYKKAVKELDPDRLYVSHSADDQLSGFGPYTYVDPKSYAGMAGGFKSEIGMASIPVFETVKNMIGNNPLWPFNNTWYSHDYQSNADYVNAIESRLGKIKDAEDFSIKAQFVNYENLRAIFEAWNQRLWNNASGVLLWMTHPAWYSTVWQLYDYDFEVGGAWAGSKKGCETYHVQASITNWEVEALNISSKPLRDVTISSRIYNINGIQIGKTQTATFNIEASNKAKAFGIEFPKDADSLCFVKLEMKDANGKLLSDNFYWKYQRPENMQIINNLTPVTIDGKYISVVKNKEFTIITCQIKNGGNAIAPMIVLSLLNADNNERVLPAYYSDNYFWLLPGEEKEITVKFFNGDFKGSKTALKVSGINVKGTIQ